MGLQNLPYVIEQIVNRKLSEIHTSLPGQIVEYDYKTQKAKVQPLIKKQYLDEETETLPIITNVPVVWPRASQCSLTFPLLKDDYVLLLFTERAMEIFLSEGGLQLPGDTRQFHLTDCLAIPGLYPFSEDSLSTNNTDVLLVYDKTSIRLKGGKDKDGQPLPDAGTIEVIGNKDLKITILENSDVTIGTENEEGPDENTSDLMLYGTSTETITGDKTETIGTTDEGNVSTLIINGDSDETVDGDRTETVTGDTTREFGTAGKDDGHSITYFGDVTTEVEQSLIESYGTNSSHIYETSASGDVSFNYGSDSANTMTVNITGKSNVTISGNSTVQIDGKSDVTIKGKSTITGGDDVSIDITGKIDIKATGNVNLTAPQTTVNGPVTITGSLTVGGAITATGDVSGQGTSLHTHKHSGVTPGPGNTDVPI